MARVAVGLGVRELAAMAKMSPATVARFEGGQALKPSTIEAMQRALEKAGVQFIDEDGGGAGVRLAKPAKRKRGK